MTYVHFLRPPCFLFFVLVNGVPDATHGFGCEQDIAASAADLGGNVVDHHHLTPVFDRMDDCPSFIGTGASLNGTFHGWLFLSRGVTHFGGRGS